MIFDSIGFVKCDIDLSSFFLEQVFESYCHLPCFHFESPLSNSVHTVHYCACCLPTGTPIISLVLLSGKHRNAGSCQIDPTAGAGGP